MGQGGFKINDCTKQAPVDISLLRQESFTNSWMRRIFLITNQIMINFPNNIKWKKKVFSEGVLTTKWLLVRLPSGHCLRNVHRMNICNSLRQFRQLQHGEKQTNDFFKMLNVHIHDYVDYTYLQLNGLWLDRAQAGGNIDLLSSQIENISGICSELNLEKGTI